MCVEEDSLPPLFVMVAVCAMCRSGWAVARLNELEVFGERRCLMRHRAVGDGDRSVGGGAALMLRRIAFDKLVSEFLTTSVPPEVGRRRRRARMG